MREVLRSNDAVLINFAQSLLKDAGIDCFLADQHMSVVEGSIGAFPRRLLVGEQDWAAARRTLEEGGLGQWLNNDGETRA
jgi:putative signal transducing protein